MNSSRQDILLRRYEEVRKGIRRVQATAETVEILSLAGFKNPPVFDWYDVPVRENEDGQLVVDVPSNGQGGTHILEPHERATWGLPAGELDRLPPGSELVLTDLHRYRTEIRVNDTWLTTLIVDAPDEQAAGLAAVETCIKKDPSLSYDVWSVALEEKAHAEGVESPAGVPPGSSVNSASRGGESGTALDPGIARELKRRFGRQWGCGPSEDSPTLVRDALQWLYVNAKQICKAPPEWPPLAFAKKVLDATKAPASQRWEKPASTSEITSDPRTRSLFVPGCETGGAELPAFDLVYLAAITGVETFRDDRRTGAVATFTVFEAHGECQKVTLPVNQITDSGHDPLKAFMGRYRLDLRLTPLADGEPMSFAPPASPRGETPSKSFRVPIAADHHVIVTVRSLYNAALPAPMEPDEWIAHAPNFAELSAAFAVLHRARTFAEFEIPTA